MMHAIKYILVALSLIGFFNLFYSNSDQSIQLYYHLPYFGSWVSSSLSINVIILISFCVGIVWAGFLGAVRLLPNRALKKRIKSLEKEIDTLARYQEKYSQVNSQKLISKPVPELKESHELEDDHEISDRKSHLPPLKGD